VASQFVAYYRVSIDRQGRSGLGLEAQRQAVLQHLAGKSGMLRAEFIEIESGKRSDLPQLAAAIASAKKARAILVIAKLDRLARNVHFISGLMESGIDFVAADNPHANRLMVHLPLRGMKGSKSAIEPGPPCKPQRPAVFALAQTGQIVSRRRIAQKHWSGRAA
jgi:DNA invertase Pin-like site-specific DNA recombinase